MNDDQRPLRPNTQWRPIVALLLTGAAGYGCYRWWASDARLVQRYYFADYLRETLFVPDMPLWHIPFPAGYLQTRIYEGQPLWLVLLPQLVAFGLFFVVAIGVAMWRQKVMRMRSRNGRMIRGPQVISNLAWWWRMRGKRDGFYLETK